MARNTSKETLPVHAIEVRPVLADCGMASGVEAVEGESDATALSVSALDL
jgi:hypothetical protein